jgi:hypothetical protein
MNGLALDSKPAIVSSQSGSFSDPPAGFGGLIVRRRNRDARLRSDFHVAAIEGDV